MGRTIAIGDDNWPVVSSGVNHLTPFDVGSMEPTLRELRRKIAIYGYTKATFGGSQSGGLLVVWAAVRNQ